MEVHMMDAEFKTIIFFDSLGADIQECNNNLIWIYYPGLNIDRLIERIADGWFTHALSAADLVVTQVGTNNLKYDTEEEIVEKLLQLHGILKATKRNLEVAVGTITPRGDQYNKKAQEVNKKLVVRCRQEEVLLCKSNKTFLTKNQIKEGMLKKDNLHLTAKGTQALRNYLHNFIDGYRTHKHK